jgi:hypothetical protein
MEFYDNTVHHGETFAERIGKPSEFDASIGKVILAFSFLEQSMCNVITMFLNVDPKVGEIITTELSFKGLLHLLSSLFKHKHERGDFHVQEENIELRFNELMKLCAKAKELRNQVAHSSYVLKAFRVKKTAKARQGLKTTIEKTNSGKMLDIADIIASTGMNVEELPLFLGLATSIQGGSHSVKYLNEDIVISVFGNDAEL